MKVKIIEPGWETYSSDLGTVPFENGVSVIDISLREALSLGAYIQVVEIDDKGEVLGFVSPSVNQIKANDLSAEVEKPIVTLADLQAKAKAAAEAEEGFVQASTTERHTLESLQAVADKGGISAIREIATPMGIKGTSVKGLIIEILSRQPAGS